MDEEPKTETEQDATEPVAPIAEETPTEPLLGEGTEATTIEASADSVNGTSTTSTVAGPLTSERVIDIAFGVAVLTGEAIDRAAQRLVERTKEIQDQTPVFLAQAEERGRPIRQNLFGTWTEPPTGTTPAPDGVGFADPVIDALQDGDSGESVGTGSAGVSEEAPVTAGATSTSTAPTLGGGIAESLRNLGSSLGLIGSGGRQSAEDEIRSLESRVRELEQTVASGATGTEPVAEATPPAPTSYDLGDLIETPADSATYVPGTHPADETLADSPYAVSETTEEQASEAASETTSDAPAAPPAARSRKKQRESDPEPADGGEGDSV